MTKPTPLNKAILILSVTLAVCVGLFIDNDQIEEKNFDNFLVFLNEGFGNLVQAMVG